MVPPTRGRIFIAHFLQGEGSGGLVRGVNLKTDSRSERNHMVFFTGRSPSPLCFVIVESVEALSLVGGT